jgi:hypothetical protein
MPFGEKQIGGAVIGNAFYVVGGYDSSGVTGRLMAYNVPEPSSVVLTGCGIVFLLVAAWRRQKR